MYLNNKKTFENNVFKGFWIKKFAEEVLLLFEDDLELRLNELFEDLLVFDLIELTSYYTYYET